MSFPFSNQLGWREIRITGNINSDTVVLPAKPHQYHMVRRVRGSSAGSLSLKSGSTQIGSTIVGDAQIDVPGLELKTKIGEPLNISSFTTDIVDLSIQVATVQGQGPYAEV